MVTYQNDSLLTKTFYGVTFQPGEVHEVDGYINDPKMIRVRSNISEPKSLSKSVTTKVEKEKSSDKKPSTAVKSSDEVNLDKEAEIHNKEKGGNSDGTNKCQ